MPPVGPLTAQKCDTRECTRSERSGNLALITLAQPQPLLVTNPQRSNQHPCCGRVARRARFVFQSDEKGFDAVGIYDLSSHEKTWLHTTETAITHLEVFNNGTTKHVLLTEHGRNEDTLIHLNPADGARVATLSLPGTIKHLGSIHEGQGLIALESAETPIEVHRFQIKPQQLTHSTWLTMSRARQNEWIQCDVQHVTFPTFDIDPKTQEARQLHAILYTPRDTTPADERIVRIKSFYGGSNTFSIDTQIFCAAGIATFSPAVRGSWGQGMEFYRQRWGPRRR